jgi:DNA-binding NarL/FixJ family response regulator
MKNPEPTPRELEAFAAVCRYGCFKDAGAALGISPHTVRDHMSRLYVKLNVETRVEAAMALGWLVLPPPDPLGGLSPDPTSQG